MSRALKIRHGLCVGLSLFLVSIALVWAQDITTDLVAHYPLDSATTTTADVVGGNTGTLNGTPSIAAGKISNGLFFTSANADRVIATDHASLSVGTEDFTVAMWLNPSVSTTAQTFWRKGNPFNSSGLGYEITWRADLGGKPINMRINDGNLTAATIGVNVDDISGAWHHIAIACDRNVRCDIYLDGTDLVDDTDVTSKTATLDDAQTLCLGGGTAGSPCSAGSWNGGLDDVRLYKRYLSSADVAALVALGSPVTRRIMNVQ